MKGKLFAKVFLVHIPLILLVFSTGSNASRSIANDRELLNGKHFVVGALDLPPYGFFTNVSAEGRIDDLEGYVNEILLYLGGKYNFNFHYVQPHDEVFGALNNGSWNGLVGMLHRKESDLIATISVTYARSQVIEFTVQFFDDPLCLLIPYPKLDSAIAGIAKPFHSKVWFFMGISLITVIVVLWIILSVDVCAFGNAGDRNAKFLFDSLWSLLRFRKLVGRNATSTASKAPIYLVLCTSCLSIIVLINAYSSTVTSYLTAPRFIPMIDSIDDIANIPRPVFMVLKYTAFDSALLNAVKENSMVLSKIGDSLRKHPELRLTPADVKHRVADLIVDYERSYTMLKSDLLTIMERDLKATGQCRLYIAKKPWDTTRMALGLPKSSPLTRIFNKEFNWLRDIGILDYWHRRTWPRPNRCSEPLVTKVKSQTKLTLNYVSSAFLFLGCGWFASLLEFIIEIIIVKARRPI